MPTHHKEATRFNRLFDPEFLQSRKDIQENPIMLLCAQGKMDEVLKMLKDDETLLNKKNRDGNTLLLLAVVNGHTQLTSILLDCKADLHHQNVQRMDAVDYAVMDGFKNPMAKMVLAHCDFLITEPIEGPYEKRCKKLAVELVGEGVNVASTVSILGKTPDFADLFHSETDYRQEWVKNLKSVVQIIRKGVLMLQDDIAYIERDALLGGALEVPMSHRYVYRESSRQAVKLTAALSEGLRDAFHARLLDVCFQGDAMSVQGLLKAKALANVEDARGESALMRAAHNGDSLTIKCLLVASAQINAFNRNGYTALHVAATQHNREAVKVLLKAKADSTIKSNKGNTVLEFVKHAGFLDIVDILKADRKAKQPKMF